MLDFRYDGIDSAIEQGGRPYQYCPAGSQICGKSVHGYFPQFETQTANKNILAGNLAFPR